MKDFTFRNDTKLLFCNDIRETVAGIAKGKKVMVVYGGGSAKRNGCYEDITGALAEADIPFVDYGGSSREFEKIEEGIRTAKANGVTMIIGAGGASVMDSAKLIAFGYYHEADPVGISERKTVIRTGADAACVDSHLPVERFGEWPGCRIGRFT